MAMILLTSALGLTSCTSTEDAFIFTTEFVQSGATNHLKSLEKTQAELLPKYEKAVKEFQGDIDFHKEETEINIERGNLSKAYENLVLLYELTHPCGEEDCGTYPCDICQTDDRAEVSLPPLNPKEIMLERDDLDNERAFIESASDQIYDLAGEYIDGRRFDEVNVVLETFNPRVPLPSRNKDRFTKRANNLKKIWLDVLVKDAKAIEADKPAVAALFYAKARQLAEQIKDPGVKSFAQKAAELRARVVAERGYTIQIASVGGPASDELLKGVTAETYPAEIRVESGSARATLSLSTSPPRYSRSTGKTTGSFRYVSGQKDVISDRWQAQFDDCDSARGWLSHSQGFCDSGSSSSCDDIGKRQARVDEECGALDGIQKMVKQDVWSDYSYPIKLYHLDTTIDFGFVLTHADGRKRLSVPRVSDRLTDQEHDAYTAGIPGKETGVGADAANPPSESSGYRSVKSVAISTGRETVLKSFEGYRDTLAKSSSDGGNTEADALATYVILRSDKVPDAITARLKAASTVTDALELLQALD
jgi:hypothetical protein